jgi:integration host factor subunit beta
MTKSQLVEVLAKTHGITVKAAEIAVNVALESMAGALVEGHRIELRGFGSWKVKQYGDYTGRNPRNGDAVDVAPKKLPIFKQGKSLKDRLNRGEENEPVENAVGEQRTG